MKLLAIGVTALVGTGGSFTSIDLLKAFHVQLPKIRRATSVPILLPRKMPLGGRESFRVYASGGATRRGWDLELAAAPRCGGSNACFIAAFVAERGGKLPRHSNLRLATGDPAYFRGISCGASCAPASLWFRHGGVLYEWQFKDPPKNTRSAMARLAAQAIRAGPR